MKLKNLTLTALIGGAVLLFSGCSATKIKVEDLMHDKTSRYQNAYAKCGDTEKDKEIEEYINKMLKKYKIDGEDLRIECKVIDENEGNMALRMFVGWGAGKATLTTNVQLIDTKNDKKVGVFNVRSELKRAGGKGYMTEESAEYIVKKIRKDYISKLK